MGQRPSRALVRTETGPIGADVVLKRLYTPVLRSPIPRGSVRRTIGAHPAAAEVRCSRERLECGSHCFTVDYEPETSD